MAGSRWDDHLCLGPDRAAGRALARRVDRHQRGRPLRPRRPPRDRAPAHGPRRRARRRTRPDGRPHPKPDGSQVWADAAARLAEDPETGERGFAAVAWESDERIETERALLRVEDRFREMIELLPVVVYEAEPGPAGRFLYVSPQLEDMLGYTPEQWIADPLLWAARVHPADRDRTFQTELEQAELGLTSDAHWRASTGSSIATALTSGFGTWRASASPTAEPRSGAGC